MSKRIFILLLALVGSLVIVACGGGGSEPEVAAPEAIVLDYEGYDEFRYDPESATVPAGSEVTVNFENAGALEHNWLLVSSRVDPLEATEADAISGATTGELAGGESSTISFTAPPAGEYQVVCTVAGHAEGGMVAEFTVTP